MTCYGCRERILVEEHIVWLQDDNGRKFPFHRACADQPWPMFECDPPKAKGLVARLREWFSDPWWQRR